jgi:hypothetical protein
MHEDFDTAGSIPPSVGAGVPDIADYGRGRAPASTRAAAGSGLGESGAGREGSGARATVTSDRANPSGRLARGRHAIPGYGLNPSEEFT